MTATLRERLNRDCNELLRMIFATRLIWERARREGNGPMASAARRLMEELDAEHDRRELELRVAVNASWRDEPC